MKTYRTLFEHFANPLHMYCRLMDFGFSSAFSKRLGMFYERYFYFSVSRGLHHTWSSIRKKFLSLV